MFRSLARPYVVHTPLGIIRSDRYYKSVQSALDDGYNIWLVGSHVTICVSSSVGLAHYAFVFPPGVLHEKT